MGWLWECPLGQFHTSGVDEGRVVRTGNKRSLRTHACSWMGKGLTPKMAFSQRIFSICIERTQGLWRWDKRYFKWNITAVFFFSNHFDYSQKCFWNFLNQVFFCWAFLIFFPSRLAPIKFTTVDRPMMLLCLTFFPSGYGWFKYSKLYSVISPHICHKFADFQMRISNYSAFLMVKYCT